MTGIHDNLLDSSRLVKCFAHRFSFMRPRELKRLEKELADIKLLSEDSLINAETVEGDLTHWRGSLLGPEGTPYQGGKFFLDIAVPSDYPYTPPKIKFETKIWHPNISSQTGAICLDVLGKEWSPALTIRTALISIQALLSAPEPDDPQDAQVARQFKTDRPAFDHTAQYWTATYASGANAESRLIDMGFDKVAVKRALERANGDEQAALNILLG
jgi:ubiquitin-conjugating enzyme (huntingtin interacting protein 2)